MAQAKTQSGLTPGEPCLQVDRILPAYEQVAKQLRHRVESGELQAGERLPNESELCAMFGVSRSTIREALRVLAAQNLVHTTRGVTGGTFVAQIDASKISAYLETSLSAMASNDTISVANMLEAREMVEVPATRLAALRRSPAHLQALEDVIASERGTFGQGRRYTKHRSFHAVIVEAAGNPLLQIMSDAVFNVLQDKHLRPDVSNRTWASVDLDHAEIFDAVREGDSQRSAEAMHRHLERLDSLYTDARGL